MSEIGNPRMAYFNFSPSTNLFLKIFVYILPVLCEIFQIAKFLKPVNIPIPLLPYQRNRAAADQRTFGPPKDLVKRLDIFYHLPFFYFTDIYDIIFHTHAI